MILFLIAAYLSWNLRKSTGLLQNQNLEKSDGTSSNPHKENQGKKQVPELLIEQEHNPKRIDEKFTMKSAQQKVVTDKFQNCFWKKELI